MSGEWNGKGLNELTFGSFTKSLACLDEHVGVDDHDDQRWNIERAARRVDHVGFVIREFTLLQIVEVLQVVQAEHRGDDRRDRDRR